MIGPRIGAKVGARVGSAVGAGADQFAPASGAASMPTYVTAGAAAIGTGAVTATMPAHQAGDILLLSVLMAQTNNATPATPSGWTLIGDASGVAFGSVYARTTCFWKRAASGSETAPLIADGDDTNEAQIHVFRGCVASGTPYDSFTATGDGDVDNNWTASGHTTLGANRLVVIVSGTADAGRNAALSSVTNAALANITVQTITNTDPADLVTLAVITGGFAVAGAIGTTTGTWTGGASPPYATGALVISLKP